MRFRFLAPDLRGLCRFREPCPSSEPERDRGKQPHARRVQPRTGRPRHAGGLGTVCRGGGNDHAAASLREVAPPSIHGRCSRVQCVMRRALALLFAVTASACTGAETPDGGTEAGTTSSLAGSTSEPGSTSSGSTGSADPTTGSSGSTSGDAPNTSGAAESSGDGTGSTGDAPFDPSGGDCHRAPMEDDFCVSLDLPPVAYSCFLVDVAPGCVQLAQTTYLVRCCPA